MLRQEEGQRRMYQLQKTANGGDEPLCGMLETIRRPFTGLQKEKQMTERPCGCGVESELVCVSCWERVCEACCGENYLCKTCEAAGNV